MEIDATAGLAAPTASERVERTEGDDLGRDAFMQLLVTQLQNQDPLDPMDSREMISQLSDLTSVEQLVAIEGRLTALEIGTAGIANSQATELVGRTVRADGSSLRLNQSGPARTSFTLDARATDVQATIRDASGEVVREISLGGAFPGPHAFAWDGLDSAGERLPAGRYRVEYSATSEAGTPVNVSSDVVGSVSGVAFEHGHPELLIGEARVLLGDVISVER